MKTMTYLFANGVTNISNTRRLMKTTTTRMTNPTRLMRSRRANTLLRARIYIARVHGYSPAAEEAKEILRKAANQILTQEAR